MKLCFVLLTACAIANAATSIHDYVEKQLSSVQEYIEDFTLNAPKDEKTEITENTGNTENIDNSKIESTTNTEFTNQNYDKSELLMNTQNSSKYTTVVTFTSGASKRYQIVPYLKGNWMMANMYCRLIGMRPVSILSQEEDDAIIQTITNAGLTDENFWTTGIKIDGTFYWFESGQKLKFSNWGEGEPNNKYGNEECVGLYEYVKLKWNDFNCHERLHILCEENVDM